MLKLAGSVTARGALSWGERRQMQALLEQHFDGVSTASFEADLAEKDWVVRLLDPAGRLRAFSTLQYIVLDGVHTVFSGDTIVDPEAWGSFELHKSWIALVRGLAEALAPRTLYWLLICSGWRTYRFLPVFFRDFAPRPSEVHQSALLTRLARARFGERFEAASGVVRLASPQVLRPIADERHRNEHAAYFERRNPGWVCGDELVCLAELSRENLTSAGRRMWDAADLSSASQPEPARLQRVAC
jgi:hypothetical protein